MNQSILLGDDHVLVLQTLEAFLEVNIPPGFFRLSIYDYLK